MFLSLQTACDTSLMSLSFKIFNCADDAFISSFTNWSFVFLLKLLY